MRSSNRLNSNDQTTKLRRKLALICVVASVLILNGCSGGGVFRRNTVVPRTLRDVPVERLAFTFTPDVATPPPGSPIDIGTPVNAEIQAEFDRARAGDALLRTYMSPDKQRAVVAYATSAMPEGEFGLDLYASNGSKLHEITPEGLSGAFATAISWSPDGNYVAFIGRRAAPPPVNPLIPGAEELGPLPPGITPTPLPPLPPTVATYPTEQLYLCTRDGTDLKPLTRRPGLIYFNFAWSPDSHSLAAMACLESEWTAREAEGLGQVPAGRPRLINISGRERLLDDKLTDVMPVWCPDSSKLATAFEYDVKLYDAVGDKPGQAIIVARDLLLTSSRAFDAKTNPGADATGDPVSFYPVANLLWPDPKTLFVRTGYVPKSETDRPVNVFSRWHLLQLSPQAALLK